MCGGQADWILEAPPSTLVNLVYLKIHNGILTKSLPLLLRNNSKKIRTIQITFPLYKKTCYHSILPLN